MRYVSIEVKVLELVYLFEILVRLFIKWYWNLGKVFNFVCKM